MCSSDLTQASHKLAEQMYKAAQPQQGGPAGDAASGQTNGGAGQQQGEKKDESVIDAEYVDVEDKK